jgi:large subunit ribosomal protein L10
MVREDKLQVVKEIKEKIEKSSIVLFMDFRGLNVTAITNLRKKCIESNVDVKIYKNTLARIAFNGENLEYDKSVLVGPTGILTSDSDPVAPAKILFEFSKKEENLSIKGGFLNNTYIPEEAVIKLAQLPGREELLGKFVCLLNAPINNFVLALSSPLRGFINVLNSVKEKKQEV